ncbi:MAG TPA: UDP-glucose--dolichyl-phosphate glucosyltransferase [Flavobacteriales bacterium]|nr:UDP-glucose--dolichyl-phosphate glucosyltransferase [Flavobacteriales bacterium]
MSETGHRISVIIPAFNEENSVGKVIAELPKNLLEDIIVVNNNSNDNTSDMALKEGAIVIDEPVPGYGRACLKGMDYLKNKQQVPDIVVFLDADYSDYPNQLMDVAGPIINENYDMVIGSRELGNREKGSMTFPQIFGNKLATRLIYWIYKVRFTDLGPFRAIKFSALMDLNMTDLNYGWTVEMQVKAAKKNLKCTEVPVDYRKRIGFSKVSGTVKGAFLAGYKIITTIVKYM